MTKLRLNKQSLQQERARLKLYARLLPSLDLKRRQLLGEAARARHDLKTAREEMVKLGQRIGAELPMLAHAGTSWDHLLQVREVVTDEENVVGVRLPVLKEAHFDVAGHACLDTPVWMDLLLERLQESAVLALRARVAEQRADILAAAVRKITQRVNLFEKVLIPNARKNIRHIQIHLDDMDRAAVVRSKLAKAGLHTGTVADAEPWIESDEPEDWPS